MKHRDLTREQAAERLRRFNALIRQYAAPRGLTLIDADAAFDGLDRARLQWDFAHMTFEGYELLAETMYEAIRNGGLVRGDESPRRLELMAKYRRADGRDQAAVRHPR